MNFRYPGETETQHIGRLIDLGHPYLFAAVIIGRHFFRLALSALLVATAIYAPKEIENVRAAMIAAN